MAVFAFLFANILQHRLALFNLHPLSGLTINSDTLKFTTSDWLEGNYQLKFEEKIKNKFGFSALYVRLNNQINYSIYNKANANGVIIGEQNYLYELNYINAYYGLDYIGIDAIKNNIRKLKVIQDSLEHLNKHLLLVFCPGKASFYPEYIPIELRKPNTEITNMRSYIQLAEREKINHLNLYDLFLREKKNSKHVLYTKYGIHWSSYGEYIALQSISETMKNRFNISQGKITADTIEKTVIAKQRDMDIIDGLNLLFKPKNDTLSYPIVRAKNKPHQLPNAIVISDSFYWGIFGKSECNLIFNRNEFWYYYTEAYCNDGSVKQVKDINLRDAIYKNDVFIIMATEATINNFGWGAIDKFYKELTMAESSADYKKRYADRLLFWKNYIKNDPKWLKDSELRGKNIGVNLDSAITLDAMYQVELGN